MRGRHDDERVQPRFGERQEVGDTMRALATDRSNECVRHAGARRSSRVGTRSAEFGRDRPADAHGRRRGVVKSDAMRSQRQHQRRRERQRANHDVRGVDGDVLLQTR